MIHTLCHTLLVLLRVEHGITYARCPKCGLAGIVESETGLREALTKPDVFWWPDATVRS
jgi:hypothetical protein